MLSNLLQYPRQFFSRLDLSRGKTSTITPDKQLQDELEQAAKEGMVATRSQDHTLDDVEVQEIIENGPPSKVKVKKRKSSNGEFTTPQETRDQKRRRTSTRKENEISTPPSTMRTKPDSAARENESSKRKNHQVTPEERSTKQTVAPTSTPPTASQPSTKSQSRFPAGQEVMTSVVINLQKRATSEMPALERSEESTQKIVNVQDTKRGRPSKLGNKETSKETTKEDMASPEATSEPAKAKSPPIKVSRFLHRRFGSEEIEVPKPQPQREAQSKGDFDGPSEESDNEAPVAVSAAAEKHRARVAAIEADKAAAQQIANERVKRRERDLRLKLQAKSSKKHSWLDEQLSVKYPTPKAIQSTGPKTAFLAEELSSAEVPSVEATTTIVPHTTAVDEADVPEMVELIPETAAIIDEQRTPPVKHNSSNKASLPALLPAEILATEPTTRLLTPPLSAQKVPINKKRIFLDIDSKSPKDIKVGKTKVRILQDSRTTLPPKASVTGKALRESWLMGRRGLKGAVMPRRKPSGGFIRK